MIDEGAVRMAKFWQALSSLRDSSKVPGAEFENFALIVLSVACVAHSPTLGASKFDNGMWRRFATLREAGSNEVDGPFWQAWRECYTALSDLVGASSPIEIRQEPELVHEFCRILNLLEQFRGDHTDLRQHFLECFDEVFHRVASRSASVDYRSGDTSAALAAHLSAQFASISEYFALTGEFAVIRKTALDLPTTARVVVIDRLNFLVSLRLRLHNIEEIDIAPSEYGPTFPFHRHFLLIDQPRRNAAGRDSHLRKWSGYQSSLGALGHLLRDDAQLDASLVVVPGADRSAGGWRCSIRKHLVHSGRVLAAIDLPLRRVNGSRRQITAWLLREGAKATESVLMIDAKGLSVRGELRETELLMAFVAAIVSLGVPDAGTPEHFTRTHRSTHDDLKALMNAYFKEGYTDVDGICRRVSVAELAENEYKLVASTYLGSAKKIHPFMPLLNCNPVIEALFDQRDDGKRIYIIGNNGEGKSILLSDLAERLIKQGHRVVGISFGLTDRFRYEPYKNEEQAFVYAGARTSERGIAVGRTSADVSRIVKDIHTDPSRLDVFNRLVAQIGFGERRYIVPTGLKGSFDDDRAILAELQELTPDVDENARILRNRAPHKYELGLMRHDSQHSITTFAELSSGEKQLLVLALKLTAYAELNTIILVDEPELSLHVSWQRAIPAMLNIVGESTKCSAVVATHSPVVIASATHPGDQCFVAHRHAMTELTLKQRRSVESALFEGFRTYTPNNRQVHERCATLVSQAIQGLNLASPVGGADVFPLEPFFEELEQMDEIIGLSDATCIAHAREHRELIASTRAALTEIAAIRRTSTP